MDTLAGQFAESAKLEKAIRKNLKIQDVIKGSNMNKWPLVSLAEISSKVSYGYTASANKEPVGPKFLRITDIGNYFVDWSAVPYCNISDSGKEKYQLKMGDICIARTGASTGISTVIKEEVEAVFASYLVRFQIDDQKANSFFVGFVLKSELYKQYINSVLGGSAQPNANAKQLGAFKFSLPPFSIQQQIVEVLSCSDDKIELNRKMNETLEAIAQAIFKSWFVDFDPVIANANNRQPSGMDAETAALFPDSFEDSKLGKIPRGWKVGKIGDDFDINMGQSPPGNTYNEEGNGIPFYQGRRDFGFRYPSVRIYCSTPKRLAKTGDTLVSVRAPVGDTNMALTECCIGRGVSAVRHKSDSRSYTYYAMQSLRNYFARFEGEGTVFGSINKTQFNKLEFVLPTIEIIAKFEQIVGLMDEQIENFTKQNFTLASIRDTLLPKLLSGKLRISEAEKFVEDIIV